MKQRMLRIAYQLYFFFIGLIMIILSSIGYSYSNDKIADYRYLNYNWKQDVIIDVSVNCTNPNFVIQSLYQWPGTIGGCDCRYETGSKSYFNFKNKIYDNHECNITQRLAGCLTIKPIEPQLFTQWIHDNSNPFTLCVKRLSDYNWATKAPNGRKCNFGEKKCGNSIDNERFFCVPNSSPCPITELSFIKQSDEFIQIDSEKLYITRNNDLPLIELRITEAQVCVKNNVTNISKDRKDYLLIKNKREQCQTDERFQMISQASEQKYFQANNMEDLPNRLSGYDINDNYIWGLYSRQIIEWKQSCRGLLLDDFISQEEKLNLIESKQFSLLLVSVMFFIIISVGFSYVSFKNLNGYDWPCIKGHGKNESNKIFKIEAAVKAFIQGIYALVLLTAFSTIAKEISFFNELASYQCSDFQTNQLIIDLRDTLEGSVYESNLYLLIIYFLSAILDCYVLYQFYLKEQKKLKKKMQKQKLVDQEMNLIYYQTNLFPENLISPYQSFKKEDQL